MERPLLSAVAGGPVVYDFTGCSGPRPDAERRPGLLVPGGRRECFPADRDRDTHRYRDAYRPGDQQGDAGADCAAPGQCISGFCVDGVCCGSVCNGPGEYCDTPNQPGICVDRSAPAPAMGGGALALSGLLLSGIAALALRRRR